MPGDRVKTAANRPVVALRCDGVGQRVHRSLYVDFARDGWCPCPVCGRVVRTERDADGRSVFAAHGGLHVP